MDYFVRIRFEGFREVVDALGGVDIYLNEPKAGYPAGWHHLTGRKALAFVRDRSGSDDFFRMSDGQLMVKSIFRNMLNPFKWPRLPAVTRAFFNAVDTNLPGWMWPRLGLLLLYKGPEGIDYHIIDRHMVTPFTTDQGAQVLRPDWNAVYPVVQGIFGISLSVGYVRICTMESNFKVVATNRKASHEYFLLERIEAGIALHGSEIKSIRAGQMSLAEAYIRVDGDQAWLEDAHIAPYEFAGIFNHEPRRPRKLLLHKKQIRQLMEPGAPERRDNHPVTRLFERTGGQRWK